MEDFIQGSEVITFTFLVRADSGLELKDSGGNGERCSTSECFFNMEIIGHDGLDVNFGEKKNLERLIVQGFV